MGNWAKVWLATSMLGLVCVLSACGKDNGQDSVQANTAPPKSCWNGQCNWGASSYPNGQWQAFPRYASGAYNFAGYSNSGCGMYGQNFYPYYDQMRGLICVPMDQNVNTFWRGSWAGGYYYQACDVLYQTSMYYPNGLPNPCPGRCFSMSNTNSVWGNGWNTGTYARYGVCQ